jgi:GT2 family glycosyltransferase
VVGQFTKRGHRVLELDTEQVMMTMTTTNPEKTAKVLVIIVTWNKKEYIINLLASLAELCYPKEAIDVLVVDNASSDGTANAINERYPHVHLICNPENLGGTGGFNTGLQWAFEQPEGRYNYIWLLDNDVLVHRRALIKLVALLEEKEDAGAAGSTMMQLDYPWRINEMGGFVKRNHGGLVLNRHCDEIVAWKGRSVEDLLSSDVDLTVHLMDCRSFMDVDYVAAASLLVRADVAREAGLWMDFFIHYDDVEWCLRIARMGKRVLVSAKSLIWHLSAVVKVPTWVLFYDNRNLLYLLGEHGADEKTMTRVIQRVLMKALFYTLIGKPELGRLHIEAVDDFAAGRMGKKEIRLALSYRNNAEVGTVFMEPSIRKILVPWTINMHATGIQESLVQAVLRRPELQVDFLTLPGGIPVYQFPGATFVNTPGFKLTRWIRYWQLRRKYDLVLQSDYQPLVGLSWLGTEIMFLNDEGFCRRSATKIVEVFHCLNSVFRRWRVRPKIKKAGY